MVPVFFICLYEAASTSDDARVGKTILLLEDRVVMF